jgi:hypothetical protein
MPYTFDCAKAHGCGPRVFASFVLGREFRPTHQKPQLRQVLRELERKTTWCGGGRPGGERSLHDSVFERLVREHDHATAERQGANRSRYGPAENAELVVDLDAQRLEYALRGMAGALDGGGGCRDQEVDELAGPREGGDLAGLDDLARIARGELLFAVFVEDAAKVRLAVFGEDTLGRQV